jgi:hypothetical protein
MQIVMAQEPTNKHAFSITRTTLDIHVDHIKQGTGGT